MNFGFLYDPQRQLFAIGYRLADAEGPGRLDASLYDLLASEARLASFVAIAKGDVPQSHWFHLGRLVTSVDGAPTLLSWSAHDVRVPDAAAADADAIPGTLLDQSLPRWRCGGRSTTAASAACPGASRSRRTTSSIGTATISTRRSACPGSG